MKHTMDTLFVINGGQVEAVADRDAPRARQLMGEQIGRADEVLDGDKRTLGNSVQNEVDHRG